MKYEPKLEKEIMCPIEYGLDIFGGKWKSRILCVLSARDAVLAAMLKEMMADELERKLAPCQTCTQLRGFDSVASATAYLDSAMFKNDVFVGLKPLWDADPDVKIYSVA